MPLVATTAESFHYVKETPPYKPDERVIDTASHYVNLQYDGNFIGYLSGTPYTVKAYYNVIVGFYCVRSSRQVPNKVTVVL